MYQLYSLSELVSLKASSFLLPHTGRHVSPVSIALACSCLGAAMVQTEPNSRTNFTSPLNSAAYLSLYVLLQVHRRLNATQCDQGSQSAVARVMRREHLHRAMPCTHTLHNHLRKPCKWSHLVKNGLGVIRKKWVWTRSIPLTALFL